MCQFLYMRKPVLWERNEPFRHLVDSIGRICYFIAICVFDNEKQCLLFIISFNLNSLYFLRKTWLDLRYNQRCHRRFLFE